MFRKLLLGILIISLPACGDSTVNAPSPASDPGDGLRELGEVYKFRASNRMPVPTKVEDLAENEAAMTNAWNAIQAGKIVVVWRVGYSSSSSEVLAYEKDAPSNGGKVLLRNGTVKEMSAEQFRAAKK